MSNRKDTNGKGGNTTWATAFGTKSLTWHLYRFNHDSGKSLSVGSVGFSASSSSAWQKWLSKTHILFTFLQGERHAHAVGLLNLPEMQGMNPHSNSSRRPAMNTASWSAPVGVWVGAGLVGLLAVHFQVFLTPSQEAKGKWVEAEEGEKNTGKSRKNSIHVQRVLPSYSRCVQM